MSKETCPNPGGSFFMDSIEESKKFVARHKTQEAKFFMISAEQTE